jgi:hypothetical protein
MTSYEADFLEWLLKNKDRKLAQTFISSFRYIDGVLSLNNSRFGDYLHRIYPDDLEVNDTTDTQKKYKTASALVIIQYTSLELRCSQLNQIYIALTIFTCFY